MNKYNKKLVPYFQIFCWNKIKTRPAEIIRKKQNFRAARVAFKIFLLVSALCLAGKSAPLISLAATPAEGFGLGEYSNFIKEGDIRRFAGETLFFNISFLWFDNAADAKLGFYEKDGIYYSVLEGQTKGIVGFFTSYRKNYYKATFEVTGGGRRVRTKTFEKTITVGRTVKKHLYIMDYLKGEYHWKKYKNGKLKSEGGDKITEGRIFDDILAAFYNFRNGGYGPIKKGNLYTIYTIPGKGVDQIIVRIEDDPVIKRVEFEEERPAGQDFLINVNIPKEIFKTKTGDLRFWSSRHYIPLETRIEDYALLGDLQARFKKRVFNGPSPQN